MLGIYPLTAHVRKTANYIHWYERDCDVTSEQLLTSGGHVVCAQSFSSDVHSGSLFIDE